MGNSGAESGRKDPPRHDILLIRDEPDSEGTRFERFRVDKKTGKFRNGPEGPNAVKQPEGPNAEGYRPTMNLGATGKRTADDPARGPVLSALPLHPSPAASAGTTCYLLNAQNLNYTTTWTAEEWNDRPEGFNAEGYVRPDSFSLLIASPSGKVYYLEKKVGPDQECIPVGDAGSYVFQEVALGLESEIWMQLRNGCVVGSAMFEHKPNAKLRKEKVVPLVNIDSLTPRKEGSQ